MLVTACVAITLSVSVTIMSKGSSPRPFNVTNEEYANRWNAIFGKDNDSQENKEKALESDRPADTCPSGSSDNPEGQAKPTEDA